MITYRKAAPEDAASLAQLRTEMLAGASDAPDFEQILFRNTKQYIETAIQDGSYTAWVAEDAGAMAGMGGITYYTLPPNDWCLSGKTAYIGNMYTHPAYRGKGVGASILKALLAEAKSLGTERIILNSTDMGRPLYEKYGFTDYDDAMAYFPFRKR